jgi:adenine-specific DNA-methyltransferase
MLPAAPTSCKVYTPGPLAEAMVSRLCRGRDLSWLEPCVGSGIFLEKLGALGVRPRSITAIDLDRKQRPNDSLAHTLRGRDFLRWYRGTQSRFDRIVGNPPFVSIKRLPARLRSSALEVKAPDGGNVPLGANCWYAFLCASLGLLKPGGILAFVLPAAWDYAGYATPLRDTIHTLFEKVEVHRSRVPIFSGVQDGSIVLLAHGFGKCSRGIQRTMHADSEDLISCLLADPPRVQEAASNAKHPARHQGCRLGDILDIRIGAVTGDANFFLLTDEQRRDRGLPLSCLKPVVSKARHLRASELTPSEWRTLRDNGERIWLFRPSGTALSHRAVKAYLRLPMPSGGCNREAFKVKKRKPWYRPTYVEECDGFISGMSTTGPRICFAAMPGLSATNTLYVVKFRKRLTRSERFAWALALLSTAARVSLQAKCRIYADGLQKHEPGDLASVIVPAPREIKNAEGLYKKAVEALLMNDEKTATSIADRCFDST